MYSIQHLIIHYKKKIINSEDTPDFSTISATTVLFVLVPNTLARKVAVTQAAELQKAK
jgi:hypothetical protein